jgi:hypothetical protein
MSRQQPPAEDTSRIFHVLPVVTDSTTVSGVKPDRTFAYSDADWREIKLSLARVGIDADVKMIGDRWWAQPYPATALAAAPQRPLREQLQEMAADYRGLSRMRKEGCSLTPKQEAAEIQKVLSALERAHFTLNSSRVGIIAFGSFGSGAIREAMSAYIAKLKRYRDGLMASQPRSSGNARKVHIEYWGELVVLWKAITAGQAPRGLHFLYACSAPAFPEETIQGRIRTFLDQLQ